MKTFQLPASDSGHFVGGVLDENTIASFREHDPDTPQHGIVIWYRDKETCKAALQAVMNAHWPEPNA